MTVEEARAQRDAALEEANRIRVGKAKLKRAIGSDESGETLATVFEGSHGRAGDAMRVLEALMSAPRVGRSKARRIILLSGAFVGASDPSARRVDELSDRQAAALAAHVRAYFADPRRIRERDATRERMRRLRNPAPA